MTEVWFRIYLVVIFFFFCNFLCDFESVKEVRFLMKFIVIVKKIVRYSVSKIVDKLLMVGDVRQIVGLLNETTTALTTISIHR